MQRIGERCEKAVLSYEVLKTFEVSENRVESSEDTGSPSVKSLVRVKLDTGRHHQIRVQMENMGCPIWGDTKYGLHAGSEISKGSWQQIALCAYRLEFVDPKTKKKMVFKIEPEGDGFFVN